jgi:hypothetical protein
MLAFCQPTCPHRYLPEMFRPPAMLQGDVGWYIEAGGREALLTGAVAIIL